MYVNQSQWKTTCTFLIENSRKNTFGIIALWKGFLCQWVTSNVSIRKEWPQLACLYYGKNDEVWHREISKGNGLDKLNKT